MKTTMTRKEYMKDSSNLHHEYYLQFANKCTKTVILNSIGEKALMASKDEHLNDIPMKKWDKLAGYVFRGSTAVVIPHFLPHWIDCEKLKEAKEGFSCSTGVCILKAVAKEIIEELKVSNQ